MVGIDLSQTTDLTAAVLLIEKAGTLNVFSHFWLPETKIEEATARDGIPYSQYIAKGYMSTSGENYVDYHDCYQWLVDMIEKYEIYPLKVGYDRYSAQYLVQDLQQYGFHVDSVHQGTNLTGIINNTEGMLKDGRIQIADGNQLMKIHMLDSALKVDAESNLKKLIKVSKNAHIDGMAALLDAMCMRQVYWTELGDQLMNA